MDNLTAENQTLGLVEGAEPVAMSPELAVVVSAESTPPVVEVPKKSKKKLFLIVGLVILILIGLGVGGYLGYKNLMVEPVDSPTPVPTIEPTPTASPDPTMEWETYSNTKYNYQFKYPNDWTAHSVEPGPGDVALSSTSHGFSVHPNVYKSTVEARAYIQLETDGSENLAVPTYEKYLEKAKSPYYTVQAIGEQEFAHTQATVIEGVYDGYGYPATIKTIHFPSQDKKTYFAITIFASVDSTFIDQVNQVLSTFEFVEAPYFSTPTANSRVTSPLAVTGVVPTGWMFEGNVPVKLLDGDRNLIIQAPGSVVGTGDWMDEEPDEFTATLTFTTTAKSGYLVVAADNPSGNPENDKSYEIPVQF